MHDKLIMPIQSSPKIPLIPPIPVQTMKYQIGDKILVLHSNDEGEVIEIMNDKMVMISVRGVKFPAYMDQIDFPYFKRFTEKKLFPADIKQKTYIDQVPKEKIKQQQKDNRTEDGIWLALIPKFENDIFGDEVVSSFNSNPVFTLYSCTDVFPLGIITFKR